MKRGNMSSWDGSVFFINNGRIVFIGAAGTAVDQAIHAIKICIALEGDFELITNSRAKGNRYSAVIINAGITHTIKCHGSKIFLLYLLPETQVAKEVRWEFLNNDKDNGSAGVYDIPKSLVSEALPFLGEMLRGYSTWRCREASDYSDKVIRGLGRLRHRQLSTSSDLSEQLNEKVKRTIDYIYTEIQAQVIKQPFDLKRFTTPVICRKLKLPPGKVGWLNKEFKEETGVTIKHFFHDIQMHAALRLYAYSEEIYAVTEKLKRVEESKLLQELKRTTITRKERAKLLRRLEEVPKKVLLTQIARTLGFGPLTNLGKRVFSRLGISMADLRGRSNFFSCEGESDLK
jgi:AraC-like DNA-binding protein